MTQIFITRLQHVELWTECARRILEHLCRALYLNSLSDAAWYEFRPLIQPCWNYLSAFSDWLHTTYSPETHPEVFEIVNDTILLIESAAHVCNIQLLASSDI